MCGTPVWSEFSWRLRHAGVEDLGLQGYLAHIVESCQVRCRKEREGYGDGGGIVMVMVMVIVIVMVMVMVGDGGHDGTRWDQALERSNRRVMPGVRGRGTLT